MTIYRLRSNCYSLDLERDVLKCLPAKNITVMPTDSLLTGCSSSYS
jgi:hypothetical protein